MLKYHFFNLKKNCFHSTVYKCINAKGEECCIKKIRVNKTTRELEMVSKEVYLLVKLRHPRVISIQSSFFFAGDNHIYIVMEYAKNGSLMNLLNNRRGRILNGNVSQSILKKKNICFFCF